MDLGPFSNDWSITVRNQTNVCATDDTNWCGEDPQHEVWCKLSVNVPTEVTVHAYVSANFNMLIAFYSGSCRHLMCTDHFRNGDQNTCCNEHPARLLGNMHSCRKICGGNWQLERNTMVGCLSEVETYINGNI